MDVLSENGTARFYRVIFLIPLNNLHTQMKMYKK